jgi:hypothetical protein
VYFFVLDTLCTHKNCPILLVLEIRPSASGLCWDTGDLSGVARITSQSSANASGFDYNLAPPSMVLASRRGPSASGLNP